MRKTFLFTILLIVVLLPLQAQSFEEKQKQWDAQFNAYEQKKDDEFRAYYERLNAQYAEYLKRKWQEHKSGKPVEKPKDDTIPPIKFKGDERVENRQQKAVVIEKPVVEPAPQPKIPDPEPEPEPVKVEPVKIDTVKVEPVKEEPVKVEPVKEEPVKVEPVKEEPVKVEPVKEEPVKVEPVKEEPVKVEPVKEELVKVEPVKEEPVKVEPVKEEPVKVEPVKEEPVKVEPVKEEPVKPVIAEQLHKFQFYGTEIACRFPSKHKIHLTSVSGNSVSDAWTTMSDQSYYNLIKDCLHIRDSLKLCDWAYLKMLQSLAESVYGVGNDATFTQAYLFCKSGYAMRFASFDNTLVLLVGSNYDIYDCNRYYLDGMWFYQYGGYNVNSIDVSDAKFEGERPVELLISDEQNFMFTPTKQRQITSKMGVSASCSVNSNAIDFYNIYPTGALEDNYTTRWLIYANVPMDRKVADQLYPQLRAAIEGKSELVAVNILLNWVQTSFVYQYDDTIWGHDRAFFPSETLYYPYCDCEDRSIIFTRLVRDLLHLDAALVHYPGHLAAAVRFNEVVRGNYFLTEDQKRYTVCDPTCTNAPVGMTMPRYANCKDARLILL